MANFLDSSEFLLFYFVLNIVIIILNTLFLISRKRENSANKLKFLIIFLLGTSIIIFGFTSFPYLIATSDSLRSSDQVLMDTIFLFLLCFSTVFFIYSVHHSDDDIVELKKPSFFKARKGKIKIGRIVEEGRKKGKFFLSLEDLEKHMFVCGATGTGKSNFLQNFLINITKSYKIPFLLAEFKGEYQFLQRKIIDLMIIRPGENFSINIFNPGDTLPEIHAERIFDILKSGKFLDDNAEFSPQMEKVLVEILTKVCKNKQFQSWDGFYKYCKGYAKNKRAEIPMLSQTLISITNRIRRFSLGPLKAIFGTEHKIKTENLFDRNILIDLSSIIRLGGEKEDALFFLNMVLKYLWDKNLTRGAYNFQGIKHITIVEDAQYFAPKDLTKKNKLTSYLEDIALLQRGTGECLISLATHPDISEEILANCGVLVCFKTHIDKEFLCKLLNVDGENEEYLSILEKGQCIVRVNSIKRPFLLDVPYIQREWLKSTEINETNRRVLDKFEKPKMEREDKITHHSENSGSYLNIIKNRIVRVMRTRNKHKKEKLDSSSDFDFEDEYLESVKKEFLDVKTLEPTSDSEGSFEKLEKYIEKLYEKQESRKNDKSR
ncbi:MAG TPA: ATP-binding protein [archaeon]|nr:ATP-binding protein [archaeon]